MKGNATHPDAGILPSEPHATNDVPAADELVDPPLRKLAAAEEAATPLSVAASVDEALSKCCRQCI